MADYKSRRKTAKALPLSVFAIFKDMNHALKISLQESSTTHGLHKEMDAEPPRDVPVITAASNHLTDSSDIFESEEDKNPSSTENKSIVEPSTCPMKHEGRMLFREAYPMCVDDLFSLLFTYNKLNTNVMETMKYTDVNIGNWKEDPVTGLKTRRNNFVVPVSQPIGPKTSQVKETQVLQGCSKPGEVYVIDVDTINSGVPYCESFYIKTHFCLTCVSDSESVYTVYAQIVYRKSVWGLVKNFIEKNVWAGLEDYFKELGKVLDEECTRKKTGNGIGVSRIQKRESTKVTTSVPVPEVLPEMTPELLPEVAPALAGPSLYNISDMALWAILGVLAVLLLFNLLLFYKLSALQDISKEHGFSTTYDSKMLNEARSHEEWMSLLRKQALQHHREIQSWKKTLQTVITVIKQAENSLGTLQLRILSNEAGSAPSCELEPDNISDTHYEC